MLAISKGGRLKTATVLGISFPEIEPSLTGFSCTEFPEVGTFADVVIADAIIKNISGVSNNQNTLKGLTWNLKMMGTPSPESPNLQGWKNQVPC